jgi:hypothetical protein
MLLELRYDGPLSTVTSNCNLCRYDKDHLVTSGISFLTTVANSVHASLFSGGDTLRQVCESIIIPNLMFREDDVELFESNHVVGRCSFDSIKSHSPRDGKRLFSALKNNIRGNCM